MATGFALPTDGSAPGRARDLARREMASFHLAERVRRTVVLVVSELVTNAVQHGGPPVHCAVTVTDDMVRVAVTDEGRALPVERVSGGVGLRGRGLAIVRRVSVRWGVQEHEQGGKTVWADVSSRG
ncbi:MAG: ATP-binding protein [Nocardioidaceae bacterium]